MTSPHMSLYTMLFSECSRTRLPISAAPTHGAAPAVNDILKYYQLSPSRCLHKFGGRGVRRRGPTIPLWLPSSIAASTVAAYFGEVLLSHLLWENTFSSPGNLSRELTRK